MLQKGSWFPVLTGRMGSMIGNWILLSVGPVIIYRQTHEGIFIALYYLFLGAPSLLVGPWLGYWAQRFKPQTLMIGADVSRAVILGSAAVVGNPWILLVTLFFLTSLGYMFTTGSSLLLSHWAGNRRDALWSLLEVLHNIAVIVGPMTALLLMHVYHQHLQYTLLWDAGSFILSAFGISFLWQIEVPKRTRTVRVSPVRQVVQGIVALRKQAPQWHAVIMVYVIGMVAGYFSVMVIPYLTAQHMALQGYPLIVMFQGITGLLASLASATSWRQRTGTLYASAIAFLLLFSTFAWIPTRFAIVVSIIASMAFFSQFATVVQIQRLNALESNRGAIVNSVESLENGLELLSGLLAGLLLRIAGIRWMTTTSVPWIAGITSLALGMIFVRQRLISTRSLKKGLHNG
ncbi:MAG: MFS transporter [Firmicutes bacterium]|nr:MFS transporter [Bacillota bacterium]